MLGGLGPHKLGALYGQAESPPSMFSEVEAGGPGGWGPTYQLVGLLAD